MPKPGPAGVGHKRPQLDIPIDCLRLDSANALDDAALRRIADQARRMEGEDIRSIAVFDNAVRGAARRVA